MSAILTIGINEKGEKIKIDDATPGKKCNCFCPICNAPLIAKNKVPAEIAKHEHHFAHFPGCNCSANDETVRHKWAKDVLLDEKALTLPEGNERIPSGLVHFNSIELEKRNETYGFRPDAAAVLESGEELLIEIYVTHKVTGEKREIIEENKLNCIEIDLNHVELDKDAIRSFLLNETDYREWIGLPEKEEELHNEECHCKELYDNSSCREDWNSVNTEEWDAEEYIEEKYIEQQRVWSTQQEIYWEDIGESEKRTITTAENEIYIAPEQRSCFNCECYLSWANRGDGLAWCGPYISKGLQSPWVNPNKAQSCKLFKPKVN